jgi:hypothetical protein
LDAAKAKEVVLATLWKKNTINLDPTQSICNFKHGQLKFKHFTVNYNDHVHSCVITVVDTATSFFWHAGHIYPCILGVSIIVCMPKWASTFVSLDWDISILSHFSLSLSLDAPPKIGQQRILVKSML